MAPKTVLLSLRLFSLVPAVVGCTCDRSGEATQASASAAAASASAAAARQHELDALLEDPAAKVSSQVLEKLLLGLQACKLGPQRIDPKCEAFQRFQKGQKRTVRSADRGKLRATVGKKHLAHKSPVVRAQAAQLLLPMLAWDSGTQQLLAKAAGQEKDAAVLVGMARAAGPHHQRSDEIKQLLMKLADHSSERVRQEAMRWFLTPFSAGVEGTFEKVLDKLEHDPSLEVRASLCKRLFASGDERALEVFEKKLLSPDTPDQLRQGCFYGLVHAWTGFRRPRNPSRKAYELTLKVLEAEPRSEHQPPWTGLSALRSAKTEVPPGDRLGQQWLEQVQGWYKKARLLKALRGVASDSEANLLARTAALDVMRELGAARADFEQLGKKFAGAKDGDDWQVHRRIEMILRKR